MTKADKLLEVFDGDEIVMKPNATIRRMGKKLEEGDQIGFFDSKETKPPKRFVIFPTFDDDPVAEKIGATHVIFPDNRELSANTRQHLRYAIIKKSVVWVAVDETPDGGAEWERWQIKNLNWFNK